MHNLSSPTEKTLAEVNESLREKNAAEAQPEAKAKPQADALTERQAETDLSDLGVVAFLESGRANFQPIDPAALLMPPPSVEKLLKFRQALADAATPETAHLIPTADAVRKYGADLPKIH